MGVGAGLYMYDVVVKTFTFAISATDEFLYISADADEPARARRAASQQTMLQTKVDVQCDKHATELS